MSTYFDDIQVGDQIPELRIGPVTETQLVKYSGASGDFNPIHTVPKVAEEVGLDGVIAHGWLIMAFAGQFLTNWAGVGNLRKFKVRFSGMTKPGESIVCRGEVIQKMDQNGQRLVRGKLTVKGEDNSLKLKGDFTAVLPDPRE